MSFLDNLQASLPRISQTMQDFAKNFLMLRYNRYMDYNGMNMMTKYGYPGMRGNMLGYNSNANMYSSVFLNGQSFNPYSQSANYPYGGYYTSNYNYNNPYQMTGGQQIQDIYNMYNSLWNSTTKTIDSNLTSINTSTTTQTTV